MNFKSPFRPLVAIFFCSALWHGQSQAQERPSGDLTATSGAQASTVHPRFAYVGNEDGTIEIYTVSSQNGELRPVTYVNAGIYAGGLTMDALNKFLYVSEFVGGAVAGFAVNPNTGMLTPLSGSPFPSSSGPGQIVLHPSGKFVYVVGYTDGTVWGYSVNETTGALTPVPGNPATAGNGPFGLAITSSGKNLYVVNSSDDTLQGFSINTSTGQLTNQGTVPVGSIPESVTITPSGNFAYVTNKGDKTISGFSIGSNGQLEALAGSPFGNGDLPPTGLAIEPTGKYAYTVNPDFATCVNAFSINETTGALTLLSTTPYESESTVLSQISVDPSGKFVLLDEGYGEEWWPINLATGALTYGGLVASQGYSLAMTVSSGRSAIAYSPKFLYVLNANTSPSVMGISEYTLNATTGLATEIPGSPLGLISFPIQLTIDPLGRFVYVTGGTSGGQISAFTVNPSTGVLTPAQVPYYTLGGNPDGIVEDPTGRFLYASEGPDYVAGFSIDPVTGTLTALPGSPFSAGGSTGESTTGLAMDPLGRYLYADNTNLNTVGIGNVAAFQINPTTGALTLLPAATAGNYPVAMTVDAFGQFLFNVDEVSPEIDTYAINQQSGTLGSGSGAGLPALSCPVGITAHPTATFVYATVECSPGYGLYGYQYSSSGALTLIKGSPFFPTEDPTAMTIDPSGKFAYASHFSLGSFEAYRVNAKNGKLTSITGSTVTTTDPGPLAVLGVYK
jgi:6-phosphogluconolactonase (cycloisomerase 2 family)